MKDKKAIFLTELTELTEEDLYILNHEFLGRREFMMIPGSILLNSPKFLVGVVVGVGPN